MNINKLQNIVYYTLRPILPRRLQIFLRRKVAKYKRKKYSHIWPIDRASGIPPEGWCGWPEKKQFALVLSHDVDTSKGLASCLKLADIEEQLGFRSNFNFVPERYGNVPISLIDELKQRGFGIGVHGLYHDGKLFSSKEIFEERAPQINAYMREWNTNGFTSPAMHHNLKWMYLLDVDYCTSTFDTDPFEPQPDGIGTIFPFWVSNNSRKKGFIELPLTLPQDSTMFVILQEKTIDLWKAKLAWIAEKGGMALLNTHPDYMDFGGREKDNEAYPVDHYNDFLNYIKRTYAGKYYHGLPRDVAFQFRQKNTLESALCHHRLPN